MNKKVYLLCSIAFIIVNTPALGEASPVVIPEQTAPLDYPEETPTEKWFQEKVEFRNEEFTEKRKLQDRRDLEERKGVMDRERDLQKRRAEERQAQERKRWEDDKARQEEYRKRQEDQRRRDELQRKRR